MSGLFYFLPDLVTGDLVSDDERLKLDVLQRTEVGAILADVRYEDCALFELNGKATPAGVRPGMYICPLGAEGRLPHLVGYHPENQTWQESPCKRFWVGFETIYPVTPEDLRRLSPLVAGYDVELNGQTWHVPIVRRPPNFTNLPRQVRFDRVGALQHQIHPNYLPLWNDLQEFCEAIFGDRQATADDERRWFTLALDVLAVNYRVGRATQNVLDLLTSETWQDVLHAAVDLPFFKALAAQKKSELEHALPPSATG